MNTLIEKEFINRFGATPEHVFFCPGRINLIGEHIDYNGGRVMPAAITAGTWLAVSKNKDKLLRFQCLDFPETAALHLQSSYTKTGKEWFNYPLGIISQLLEEGHDVSGMNMLFHGDLPVGAGLSSSASIEVLTAFAINELFQLHISRQDLAVLSKKVENQFIGVNCGIMDQFAVAMGKANSAILLDCDTLAYEYLPFELQEYALVVINSNKQRTLADSKYNERFAECGAALKALRKELAIENLCELSTQAFQENRHLINDRVLERRALHVISENERVNKAVDALKSGDLDYFGELMYASHASLQDLYEVSGKELDTIVAFCKTYAACAGARMTGAGFGGCAIALVKKENVDDFSGQLNTYYSEHIGYAPQVLATAIGPGVMELKP